MKLLFLIPPSEGKNTGGVFPEEELSFQFEKPKDIAIHATEKDLKCSGKRYEEGIKLNQKLIAGSQFGGDFLKNGTGSLKAIDRYSGVMYNAIDYGNMSQMGKNFFENNFLIFSGMHGTLKAHDKIGNYKLPIETKGLYAFWGDKITDTINNMQVDYIVNLLPGSYFKMIHLKKLQPRVIHINFLKEKDGKFVKISHGVKKIKGGWIKKICESGEQDFNNFGGKVVKNGETIDINIF